MTIVALTAEDRRALMEALESRSPCVRQARVAHALLLMAKGLPASVVAEYLFLTEPEVTGYWRAFTLGQCADPAAKSFAHETNDRGDTATGLARNDALPLQSLSTRRPWVQELRRSHST